MIRLQKISQMINRKHAQKQGHAGDTGVAVAFVAAISVLLLVAGYVISRMSSDRAYREKWKDYNDCGWA